MAVPKVFTYQDYIRINKFDSILRILSDRSVKRTRYNWMRGRFDDEEEFAENCALHSVEKLGDDDYEVTILFVQKEPGTTMCEAIDMSLEDTKRIIKWFLPFETVISEALPVTDVPTTTRSVTLRLSSR